MIHAMMNRRRFSAGLLIAWTVLGIANAARAQEPPADQPEPQAQQPQPPANQQPQPPAKTADAPAAGKQAAGKQAADAPAVANPVPDSPAVAAILETNPSTPAELVRAAKILGDLQRPDLGKQFLARVIAAKLNPQQLADLAERFGSPTFSDMAARPEMLPEAKQLADAVMAAINQRLQDPKRLEQLIRQLGDPSAEMRGAAMVGLREARGAAVAALLGVLADPARKSEHAVARAALVAMGPEAIGPLLGVLQGSDPKLTVQAIQVLTALEVRGAAIYMLAPLLREKSDPELRAVAGAALLRLVGKTPSPEMAVRLLTERATAYFDRSQPVRADLDGQVELWHWDAVAKQCTPTRYDAADAALILAAQLARDAYALAPEDPDVRRLYLTTALEAEAYRIGLDKPMPETGGTAAAEAATFGPPVLEGVLDYAMAGDHIGAAIAAARMLGRTGMAAELLYQGEKPTVLVRAARHPDRRVRMAACEAIVRLKPAELFPGASYVPETLAQAAGSSGSRRVLLGGLHTEALNKMVGAMASLGFEVDTVTTGRELVRAATTSPDYELALIQTSIDEPTVDFLVQQLRHDYRSATLRVGLLARTDDFARTERIAQRDPMTMAFYQPNDDPAIVWQVDRLAALSPRTFVDHAERQRQAALALDLLAEIGKDGESNIFDLRSTRDAVLTALRNPALSLKAIAVLTNVHSAQSQQALVDVASRWTLPIDIRRAACQAFQLNSQRHGILLTAEEITRQYERYNTSKDMDQETQHVLGLLLDCIEAPSKVVQAIETPGPEVENNKSKKTE